MSNFGKIQADLKELKEEYLQEQAQMNTYLQLGAHLSTAQQSESQEKLASMQARLKSKKNQIKQVLFNFQTMRRDLSHIKTQFDSSVAEHQQSLAQLKEAEQDSKLASLFEEQSRKLRGEGVVSSRLNGKRFRGE